MIVTFGDAIVDLFALPRGSDVATAEQFVPHAGGAPANVAVVAARLGASTRFVGAVGTDAHGERLTRVMRDAGVDVGCVVPVPQRTGITFVRVGLDGARSFLFYRHGGADMSLAVQHLDSLVPNPLDGATWLHVMSSAFVAEPLAGAARRILSWAAERSVPVSVDLNVRAHLWSNRGAMLRAVRDLAATAVLVKASEDDLSAVDVAATRDGVRTLATRNGSVSVLTLAERGAVAWIGDHEVAVSAANVECVDATGAGDAFCGALLAGVDAASLRPDRAGWTDATRWQPLLARACRVGSLAVTALGATCAIDRAPSV